jgi:hypothetical protein
MLPLMSTTKTMSATPLVFPRLCGAGALDAMPATPDEASGSGAVGVAVTGFAARSGIKGAPVVTAASDATGGTDAEVSADASWPGYSVLLMSCSALVIDTGWRPLPRRTRGRSLGSEIRWTVVGIKVLRRGEQQDKRARVRGRRCIVPPKLRGNDQSFQIGVIARGQQARNSAHGPYGRVGGCNGEGMFPILNAAGSTIRPSWQ